MKSIKISLTNLNNEKHFYVKAEFDAMVSPFLVKIKNIEKALSAFDPLANRKTTSYKVRTKMQTP